MNLPDHIKGYLNQYRWQDYFNIYGESVEDKHYFMYHDEVHGLIELIVKETISEMTQQLWNYGIDESNNPSFYKAIDATKKTFGVE